MRKSTKAILIALAVLIGPAIYMTYLAYRESKIIDTVTVKVFGQNEQTVSGIFVSLSSSDSEFRTITITSDGGLAVFSNIPPGKYSVRLVGIKDCDDPLMTAHLRAVRIFIEVSLHGCTKTLDLTKP
ncbi:MAG: carboxypeptidase regulatory-like domain-containing protein [Parcubacteria group bacterium]|nr:carboxypeptidase regulatory-like domain-containing protein [Parcubacteria group bacterium]